MELKSLYFFKLRYYYNMKRYIIILIKYIMNYCHIKEIQIVWFINKTLLLIFMSFPFYAQRNFINQNAILNSEWHTHQNIRDIVKYRKTI